MADGRNYLNAITGEIITAKTKRIAVKYFKADGKVFGYKVKAKNIFTLDADGNFIIIVKRSGKICIA